LSIAKLEAAVAGLETALAIERGRFAESDQGYQLTWSRAANGARCSRSISGLRASRRISAR
jgi:hypothetical protein